MSGICRSMYRLQSMIYIYMIICYKLSITLITYDTIYPKSQLHSLKFNQSLYHSYVTIYETFGFWKSLTCFLYFTQLGTFFLLFIYENMHDTSHDNVLVAFRLKLFVIKCHYSHSLGYNWNKRNTASDSQFLGGEQKFFVLALLPVSILVAIFFH